MHLLENTLMSQASTTYRSLMFHTGIIVLVFCCPMLQTHAQTFRELDDYGWARGENYTVPAIVDIDGNGLLDLIVGTQHSGLMRWEQTAAHSDGFRRVKRDFLPFDATHQFFRSAPFIIDVDNDGRLDLLIAAGDGEVLRYVQDTPASDNFSFEDIKFGGIDLASNARIWVGDLDGNGKLDVLAGASQMPIARYEQQAAGSFAFSPMRDLVFPMNKNYPHPALMDIDGDGRLEMLLGGMEYKLSLFRQHETVKDSFLLVTTTWSGIQSAENGTPSLVDIDADGLIDLFIGTKGGQMLHYEQPAANAPDGWVLRSENVLNTWDFGLRTCSIVTDLDKDGRLDILRSDVPYEVGTFTPRPVLHFRQRAAGSYDLDFLGPLQGITAGIYDRFCVTDMNNDGRLDLFITRLQRGMEHYRQKSTAPFEFELVTENFIPSVTWVFPPTPVFADLDSDGRLDLLFAGEDRTIARLEESSPGSEGFVLLESKWDIGDQGIINFGAKVPCILDYDNDGLLDMILGWSGGKLRHLRQIHPDSARFVYAGETFAAIDVKSYSHPTVVDINKDGRLDVVVGDGNGGLSLYMDMGPAAVGDPPGAASLLGIVDLSPNPCTDQANVRFDVATSSSVTVRLFDALGREVARPAAAARQGSGGHSITLETADLPSGMYHVVITSGSQRATRNLLKL